MAFYCAQHQCFDCGAKTTNAGGMIYRCRWCERGYCEDCLNWDKVQLIGETLPELLSLDFGAIVQAYYIVCPSCTAHQGEDPKVKKWCERKTAQFEKDLKEKMGIDGEDEVGLDDEVEDNEVDTLGLNGEMGKAKREGTSISSAGGLMGERMDKERASQAASLTDAATVEESSLSTPAVDFAVEGFEPVEEEKGE